MRDRVLLVALCLCAVAFLLAAPGDAEARGCCGKRMMMSQAQSGAGPSCCPAGAATPARPTTAAPSCCESMTLAGAELGDDLSPAQKQRFDGKKAQLRRELDVCKEHCGKDETCGKKCDDTYKARLENEYKAAKTMKKGA